MVEHNLAKVGVASSNLVSRSRDEHWRRSQEVKAEVCKTSIHRFDSDRRLKLKPGWRNLVDARDLKSLGLFSPCRFDSGPRHHYLSYIRYIIKVSVAIRCAFFIVLKEYNINIYKNQGGFWAVSSVG